VQINHLSEKQLREVSLSPGWRRPPAFCHRSRSIYNYSDILNFLRGSIYPAAQEGEIKRKFI